MMSLKCCTPYASKFGKLNSGHKTGKGVFIPIPKKANAKECSNHCTVALISHSGKVRLKIIQARFPQYVNRELPDVQAGFRKGRRIRDQISNICWWTQTIVCFHVLVTVNNYTINMGVADISQHSIFVFFRYVMYPELELLDSSGL